MPVVPSKAMRLLERNLTEPDETIRISLRPNEVLMKTERAMIYSRLVEGRFPNYQQVMPQKHTPRVPLTVGPFHGCGPPGGDHDRRRKQARSLSASPRRS